MRGYHHLTYEERIKLETLLNLGLTPMEIVRTGEIKCSKSTIYREISRGQRDKLLHDYRMVRVYCADTGQRIYDYYATNKGPQLKIGNDYDFVRYMENMIVNKKYSPFAALAEMERQGLHFNCGGVCTGTVYNYIDRGDIFPHITRQSLYMKGKRKQNYDKIKRVRINKPLLRSIEDRPKEISKREVCGDWEMDTVEGKKAGKNPVLLVLTERKSRAEIIRKIPGKTQDDVIAALDEIEREMRGNFNRIFRTLTVDNGCEFLNDKGLERSIYGGNRTTVYFCHPYNSCERGSNENVNKMVRRFVPKGEDIRQYTDEYIQCVQNWINDYPRRILGGKSSNDVLFAEMGVILQ